MTEVREVSDDKKAEEALFDLRQEYDRLEQQDSAIKKRKKQLSDFVTSWEQLNKAELEILEEVSFLSQGTHSEAHALRSFDERELVTRQGRMSIDAEFDDIEHQQRKVKNELEEVESNLDRQKKAVYENG
ncbi:hypothetical protein [uncultured Enterococcus sp.]|uniref:hypothetical protein n=1 Tax=uncultured Enterococcus sp. TaxID=167972 RepID=UPI002AA788E8|nr:hypothetical protein [uncultured Enterococcus sp.]